jgi:hypothetical protein
LGNRRGRDWEGVWGLGGFCSGSHLMPFCMCWNAVGIVVFWTT